MNAVKVWECPHCYSTHGDEEDAEECCYKRPKSHFECATCGDDFDTREEAELCCGPAPEAGQ